MSDQRPACTAKAVYWKAGLRWEIVLQIMYWTSATERAAGQGPFFVVDHAWRESAAIAKVAEIDRRLVRSREMVTGWLTNRSQDGGASA